MKPSINKINLFLMVRLPAAYICGVRARSLDDSKCTASVTHRWINQNPFRSLYFAVQSMAAELTTGLLVMQSIKDASADVSMLITSTKAEFFKKATGKIEFVCLDGQVIKEALNRSLASGEAQNISLRSTGTDEKGDVVSEMEFQWSIKPRGKSR